MTAYVTPPVPTLTSTPTLFPFSPYSPSLCSTSNTNCSLTLETALLLGTLHTSRFRSSTPDIISYLSMIQHNSGGGRPYPTTHNKHVYATIGSPSTPSYALHSTTTVGRLPVPYYAQQTCDANRNFRRNPRWYDNHI